MASFSSLLQKSTFELIYQKFHAASFSTKDVQRAICKSYGIDERVIERHVLWLQKEGYVTLTEEGKYRFVCGVEGMEIGGRVH